MDDFTKMAEPAKGSLLTKLKEKDSTVQFSIAVLGCILSYLGLIALLLVFNLSAEDLDMSKNPVSHNGYSSYAILVVIGGAASLLKCVLVTLKTLKIRAADGKDDEGYTLQTLRHLSASLCVLIGGLLFGQMETDSEVPTDSSLYGWVMYFVIAMSLDKFLQLLTDFDEITTIWTTSHTDKCKPEAKECLDKRVPQGVARSFVIYITSVLLGLSLGALIYHRVDIVGEYGDYGTLPIIALIIISVHVALAVLCIIGDAMQKFSDDMMMYVINERPLVRSLVALSVLLTLSISTGQMVSLDIDNAWQFMALCLYFLADVIGRNVC